MKIYFRAHEKNEARIPSIHRTLFSSLCYKRLSFSVYSFFLAFCESLRRVIENVGLTEVATKRRSTQNKKNFCFVLKQKKFCAKGSISKSIFIISSSNKKGKKILQASILFNRICFDTYLKKKYNLVHKFNYKGIFLCKRFIKLSIYCNIFLGQKHTRFPLE